MRPPRLVIFDCDGVLVDSEPITNRLLRDDLAGRGLDLPLQEIMRRFVGGTMAGVAVEAARMGATIPDDWVDDFYARMYAELAAGTPLIDGAAALLDTLDAAGIAYCVGSNGSETKMQTTLGQHPEVWSRVSARLFSAHTLGVAKPEPDLFLIAADTMGATPADTVVIDDSPAGCRAARRAGMTCLGLAEHDDGTRLADEGAAVIRSLREVPGLFGLA